MGSIVFNVAKGAVNAYHDRVKNNDPAASVLSVVLLKTVEADATLVERLTLAAILAGGSVECDFTNYSRKVLTNSDISVSAIDSVNDRRESDIPDQTWASAGGASNNSIVKLVICYDPLGTGVDADMIPLTAHDFVFTTVGVDLLAQVAARGYFSAE